MQSIQKINMRLSDKLDRKNWWNQPVYAKFLPEVDPFTDLQFFRPLNQAYDGNNTFWRLPSPEPKLDSDFWQLVRAELKNASIQQAASRLAGAIYSWETDASKLLFVAILRAGVPVADWLCRLLPGSVSISISLFAGLGIDRVALQTLKSVYPERKIIFVDGWTGRGGVARELAKLQLAPLAVLVDPWGWADFSGSSEDLFCPTACFTGVATLGFSRTFYVDKRSYFAAYLFPTQYLRPELVRAWQNICPNMVLEPLVREPRFFVSTNLRVHSNEVCRALINANPVTIYFANSLEYVREHYSLLLTLAELRQTKMVFDFSNLKDYQTQVACSLSS